MLILQAKYIKKNVVELANGDWLGVNINGNLGELVNVIVTNENGIPYGIVLNPNFVDYVRTVTESMRKTSSYRVEANSRLDIVKDDLNVIGLPQINCMTNENPDGNRIGFTFRNQNDEQITDYIQYSSRIYLNGIRQVLGLNYNENSEDGEIFFILPPQIGDIIVGDFNINV